MHKPLLAPLPGLALCIAVAGAAEALGPLEAHVFGRDWLEPLVLAILLGTAIRTFWTPAPRWQAGIDFSAKTVLEIAIVLLGTQLSFATIVAAGWPLLVSIAGVVAVSLGVGTLLGRLIGLDRRMAILVACGNSICGNSAIAAVAPIIGATAREVASAIAFTAVLGIVVVLGLPLVGAALHLDDLRYGALAGLTVYAVPQVLAATAPVSALAVQTGTLIKLLRVLMLGPVVVVLSFAARAEGRSVKGTGAIWSRVVPWFILGFLALAGLRSAGFVPAELVAPAGKVSAVLTVIAMAALGLCTDLRSVARAGPRVTAAVVLSLVTLAALSLALIFSLRLG